MKYRQKSVGDEIGRPVGVSASDNGVTITVDAILGDKSSCMVVYSIEKDDGSAFDVTSSEATGKLPLGFDGPTTFILGVSGAAGGAYFYDADPRDNAIQYVEEMTHAGDIIGKTAHVELRNLTEFSEGAQEHRVIAEGTWKLDYAINYEDASISMPAGQSIELNGKEAQFSEITVSPIALHLTYTMDGEMTAGLRGESGLEGEALLGDVRGNASLLTLTEGFLCSIGEVGVI